MDDPQVASKDMLRATPYGFDWGPMRVERAVCDNELGWVLIVRPVDKDYPRVEIRCSPAGRNWSVRDMDRYGCPDFRPVGKSWLPFGNSRRRKSIPPMAGNETIASTGREALS
jgi:hypothetical protein